MLSVKNSHVTSYEASLIEQLEDKGELADLFQRENVHWNGGRQYFSEHYTVDVLCFFSISCSVCQLHVEVLLPVLAYC